MTVTKKKLSKKTTARLNKILAALNAGATLSKAASVGGISLTTLRNWRKADGAFEQGCLDALEAGTDALEDEAFRRAAIGTKKPVGFHQGQHTGVFVTEYSDSLLVFMLKARRPDKFKDTAKSEPTKTIDTKGAKDALLSKFSALSGAPRSTKTSK